VEFQSECLGGLKVDHEFELGGLNHRQVAWLFALKNPASMEAGLTIGVQLAGAMCAVRAGYNSSLAPAVP
jgi:hypothetical protein